MENGSGESAKSLGVGLQVNGKRKLTTLMMPVMLLSILISSCTSVPRHRIAYQVDPIKKKLCNLSDRAKPKCHAIDAKDKDGQYMFLKYDGYAAISIRAIKETFHKIESAKDKTRAK